MVFTGTYNHSIDTKGRLIVPAKLREKLGEAFMVTQGPDGCLYAYPESEWETIERSFRENTTPTRDARRFMRIFFAGACDVEVDKQGRILLPANLREYAALEKDVVFAGVMNHVEIWEPSRWNEVNNPDMFDDTAEHMAEIGVLF